MNAATTTTPNPMCSCTGSSIKWGRDSKGHQRFKCRQCGSTFAQRPARPLGNHRLRVEKALMVLGLLVEGMSIRGTERVTGVHRDTCCRLLRTVGDKAERLMAELVKGVEVADVELDEIWSFTGMKEATKKAKGIQGSEVGDAWTFCAVERNSKLILTHHTGRRSIQDTDCFMEKVAAATSGEFQLSTDAMASYPASVDYHLGSRVAYGQIIKDYGEAPKEERRKYSPARIIGVEKRVISGAPDESRICTSIVERTNLSIRTHVKRFNRLTCCFSKKLANHKAAFALFELHFNFCRFHRSLRMTPAMKAGIAAKPWSLADLVAA